MQQKLILAIDQGTSGTKTVLFDENGKLIVKATVELASSYPKPGFVEQNPEEIYQTVIESVHQCVDQYKQQGGDLNNINTCGISNQRETYLLWDETGNPLHNAVVWQCKRSVEICNRLKTQDVEKEITARTGLIIDPYFSGTKVMWLNENSDIVKSAIDSGKAFGGTVDSWLLYKLTQAKSYYTDYTNASRTLFFNINELKWDSEMLKLFGVEKLNLPEPKPSAYNYGSSDFEGVFEAPIPITGMIGDSHAAAFGEGCFAPGDAKVTLGTGSSILMNTGSKRVESKNGMVATICWSTADRTDYALEGIIVTAGASINWLKNQLGLFSDSSETEAMATALDGNEGVYLVPAFSGLGAPHWQMDARAVISGLTFGADKRHIVRAALESIPYQIKDVITAMEADAGISLKELMADGGITNNKFVMQFISDLLRVNVNNIGIADISALGAGLMAGLGSGMYKDLNDLKQLKYDHIVYYPLENPDVMNDYKGWQSAVALLN